MSLKNVKFTSVDRIFTRLKGIMPISEENDILEWIGDALEAIGMINQYVETVCFKEVKNYTTTVPKDSHLIIQLARNNSYIPEIKGSAFAPKNAIECLDAKLVTRLPITSFPKEESGPCLCECNPEELDYAPIFSLTYEFNYWSASGAYKEHFTPIRLTEHSFFNSIVCQEKDYDKIYSSCTDEYNIIEGDTLRFSFKEGQIALAYARQKMDKDGLPMIPDEISFITAIRNYCIYQYFTREYYSGTQGAEGKMNKAELEWIWYMGQSQNKAKQIQGLDEHQNFLDQRSYILPRQKKYFGFFGGLNKPEKLNLGGGRYGR